MSITTLKRRTKVHQAALAKADTAEVKVYTLGNYFNGEVVNVGGEYLAEQIAKMRSASLTESDGKITLHIHSDCWYEWSAA